MLLKFILLCLISITILFSFENTFATSDPILITISPGMENVIFDGKWTYYFEWKPSSHNSYSLGDGKMNIHLRTAHFGDYIYVFIDPVNDLTLDDGIDQAIVCLDGKNNKSENHDSNDFCFSILLGNDKGTVYQGNSTNNLKTQMQKISNPDDFISVSSSSDENDRYSKTPHPSYEFKIPIKLLERSDNYGFYFSVYDASLNKFYSWPENYIRQNSTDIPPPSQWGDIISPDKSLPELHLPILVFGILVFTIILVQSKTKIKIFRS